MNSIEENASILVSIRCAAYNHEKYIRQTLDGFVMQKTDFRFEAIIHDDCSTDGTAAIIREYEAKYPDIIKAFYAPENRYSKNDGSIDKIFEENTRGKYLTICEGDDYWTDPYKLQKQVDFLETHPDYNLVCHDWNVQTGTFFSNSPVHHKYTEPFSFTFATLPWVWITKTLTLMLRVSALDFEAINRYKFSRDVHFVYYSLKGSKGYFIPEVMATYRIHEGGIWSKHDTNEKNRTTYELYKELYSVEHNKAVRKRYMNATLAYYNGLVFCKKTWYHIVFNAKLYFEALRNISDAKDLVFCLGALVPTQWVKWVMKKFKI